MSRTSHYLVPFALCATGLSVFFFSGCERKPEVPPSSPESYMQDKPFMEKLSADRKERQTLLADRAEIVGKMKALIDAKKAELNTTDLAKVKEALEKSPEWQVLYAQCTNANKKVQAHRQATLKTVRERITPERKPISK